MTIIKNVIIWVKNNWSAGDLYGDFGNQYECIAFIPKEKFMLKSKRYSNVWHFDRVPSHKLVHPTQKPVSLIRRLILFGNVNVPCLISLITPIRPAFIPFVTIT